MVIFFIIIIKIAVISIIIIISTVVTIIGTLFRHTRKNVVFGRQKKDVAALEKTKTKTNIFTGRKTLTCQTSVATLLCLSQRLQQ